MFFVVKQVQLVTCEKRGPLFVRVITFHAFRHLDFKDLEFLRVEVTNKLPITRIVQAD